MDSSEPEGKYRRLDGILDDLWRMLGGAVQHRRSPLRTPVLITTALDGAPNGRVVILRDVNASTHTLQFHSDTRAAKITELGQDPRAQAVFYLASRKIQLRMWGQASLHHDDALAQAAWQRTGSSARRSYLVNPTPGSRIDTPDAVEHSNAAADGQHFTVIGLVIQRIDWLHLASSGHRRALFEWLNDSTLRASWRVP